MIPLSLSFQPTQFIYNFPTILRAVHYNGQISPRQFIDWHTFIKNGAENDCVLRLLISTILVEIEDLNLLHLSCFL